MFTIVLWVTKNYWTEIATVHGCEFAYETYHKTCELAELLGKDCALMDGETGEVLAIFKSEEE